MYGAPLSSKFIRFLVVPSINCYCLVMAERSKVSKAWKRAFAATIIGIMFIKRLAIASQLGLASQALAKPCQVATHLNKEIHSQDLRHVVSVCESFHKTWAKLANSFIASLPAWQPVPQRRWLTGARAILPAGSSSLFCSKPGNGLCCGARSRL